MGQDEYDVLQLLSQNMKVAHRTRTGKGAAAALWTLRKVLSQHRAAPGGTQTAAEALERFIGTRTAEDLRLPDMLPPDVMRSALRLLTDYTKPGMGEFYMAILAKPSEWFTPTCPLADEEARHLPARVGARTIAIVPHPGSAPHRTS